MHLENPMSHKISPTQVDKICMSHVNLELKTVSLMEVESRIVTTIIWKNKTKEFSKD